MSRDSRVNTSYLERKLRAIGLVGSAPLENLQDIQGFITLESDRPEWLLAGGELLYSGRDAVPAGAAGTFAYSALVNRAGSGILIVLEFVQVETANSCFLGVNLAVAAGAPFFPGAGGNATGFARDGRNLGLSTARVEFGANNPTNLGNVILGIGAPSLQSFAEPIIIAPGFAAMVADDTAATGFTVSWHWRERQIEGRLEVK